jgi:NAD(P)-dependent dehydrogenase (short-subunit alcohol dehydrogenase family)
MPSFVTGATGFIGRYLVQELLDNRDGDVFVLVRAGSQPRMERLIQQWGHEGRVTMVKGDLTEAALGVDPAWVEEHRGSIDHFFHLAAVYDMTASDEQNETMNVGGTRNAIELAADLDAGCFHQVSSIAASGDYQGFWDETMFDVGQKLPSPYHRTKFESERIVREESAVPWRVYRPSMVIGHSESGAMDKVDGPYYFFPILKLLRDYLPTWTPLVGVDLGDTNVVPVDYVASAIDHLAHLEGRDGEAFHLVNPEPQRTVDVVNLFAEAAKAPQFATPIDRDVTGLVPTGLLPKVVRPTSLVKGALRTPPARLALRESVGRLGLPAEVVEHVGFPTVYGSQITEQALAGSGISVPDLESYAPQIWAFWEEQLDDSLARDKKTVEALRGRTVVITGASSGIGMVTAFKVAQAGGIPVLVARGKEKLEGAKAAIEFRGGKAHVYPCDLSDLEAIDELAKKLTSELDSVDYLVNNAGRSIRRSIKLSQDRFHDFERTMQLNYFGAIRLVMGVLPRMREQKSGHIVNISSIGVQTNPPRFSAYVASKAALDAWSNVVSSEVVGDGISFTNIHMPLVKTPMIAPTKLYDKFPTISPAQAADMVVRALVDQPHEINTTLGTVGALAHTLVPRTAFKVLHLAYRVFPDSTAARSGGGKPSEPVPTSQQQQILARLTKGVHW